MKNILRGASSIREALEKGPQGGESRFLKLTDGESVTVRFMQEIDETGSAYDEKRGLAVGYYEHINPDDFTQSFVCTQETEGKCVGCERVPMNRKWRARGRLLMNVLVRGKNGEADKVKIFGTSISSKGLTPQLIEYADDCGSLCDRDYKLTRRGESINTTYTLVQRQPSPFSREDEAIELIDLDTVIRNLSYAEQVDLVGGEQSDW